MKYVFLLAILFAVACSDSRNSTRDTRDLGSDILALTDTRIRDQDEVDVREDVVPKDATITDMGPEVEPSFEVFGMHLFPKHLLLPTDKNISEHAGIARLEQLDLRIARDEFEPLSIVIRGINAISLRVHVSDLVDEQGNVLPASLIDSRILKSWYQSGDGKLTTRKVAGGPFLIPKFLIHAPAMLKVDHENQRNYLRVTSQGKTKYFDVSDKEAIFPLDSEVHDTATFTSLDLEAGKHAQFWITVHIPKRIPVGMYTGEYVLEDTLGNYKKRIPFSVEVLPFELIDLQKTGFESAIYYRGKLFDGVVDHHAKVLSTEWKTDVQYLADLQNLKEHGISNFTVYQTFTPNNAQHVEDINRVLTIRKHAGMEASTFLSLGAFIGNGQQPAELEWIKKRVRQLRALVEPQGYTAYFYGLDEAKGERLRSQIMAWDAVKSNGGKIFVAGDPGTFDEMGNRLSMLITGHRFVSPVDAKKEIARGHALNAKVLKYGDPFAGMTGPRRFRINYGYRTQCHGYDGLMPYVYQHGIGYAWNDFDPATWHGAYEALKNHRDMSLTYPSTDGPIDTIEWEAYREAIDDIRYIKTLLKLQPDKASWFKNRFCEDSKVFDPIGIRNEVIRKILDSTAEDKTVVFDLFGDAKVREELTLMKSALQCYGAAHQTFQILGTGWNGKGVGYISSEKGGGYQKSIVTGLKEAGCLAPHVEFETANSYPYLLYLCDNGKRFSLFGYVSSRSPSEIVTFNSACNSTANVIGQRNYAIVDSLSSNP